MEDGKTSRSTVGARQLRANQASLLRRAQGGERIVITVGGRAVAELGPISPEGALQPTLPALAAAALVVPPRLTNPTTPPLQTEPTADPGIDRLVRTIRGA